jgi:hypothetical protein
MFSPVLVLLLLFSSSLLLLSTSSSSRTIPQIAAQTSYSANSLLLNGKKFSESVCYSTSTNLRRQTITLTEQPTSAVPILRLAAGPRQVVSCIDLIEVQTGADSTGGVCNSLASLQLCSGPLGSEPLSHTSCSPINTVYTQPKTQVIGGSLTDNDREWSVRYDGTRYSDVCFPRSVQILALSQAEGQGDGSIVLLIVVLVVVSAVLCCLVYYFWYRCTRHYAKRRFDSATNVMPDGGGMAPQHLRPTFGGGGGDYEDDDDNKNDEIFDGNGEPVKVPGQQQEMQGLADDDDGENADRPPGLPHGAGFRDVVIGGDDGNNIAAMSPRNFLVNDGPAVRAAGPFASIYGADVARDHFSVGMYQQQQQQQQNRGNSQLNSRGRKSASAYRVLPDVQLNPLPPFLRNNNNNNPTRVEPSLQSNNNYFNNNNYDNASVLNDDGMDPSDRVVLCADCGVNVADRNCPQICSITGKAHF